jgi:hypothetical protein
MRKLRRSQAKCWLPQRRVLELEKGTQTAGGLAQPEHSFEQQDPTTRLLAGSRRNPGLGKLVGGSWQQQGGIGSTNPRTKRRKTMQTVMTCTKYNTSSTPSKVSERELLGIATYL